MGIMNLFGKKDINAGMMQFKEDTNGVLIDVRTPAEHMEKRIPGSINLPLDEIGKIKFKVTDLNRPIYLYCRSGNRSHSALGILQKLGYTNVHDIGGIIHYRGRTEGGPK